MNIKHFSSFGSQKTAKIHLVISAVAICGLFNGNITSLVAADSPQPQGPGWVMQTSPEELAEQQQMLTRAYLSQQSQQQRKINFQQDEVLKIYAKDPWRKINSKTSYIGDEGWLQFQGKAQAIEPMGVLFRGKFGTVLTIQTENDQDAEEVTTTRHEKVLGNPNAETQHPQKRYSGQSQQGGGASSVEVLRREKNKKVYGEDYFMVLNYPYPTEIGEGIERMMAYDCGYLTYTNSITGRVITVRKLDYGTPCIKKWTQKEIADAKRQIAEEQAQIEAAQKADAEERARILTAQQEAEAAEIEAKRQAEETRRQAEIERVKAAIARDVKKDQDEVALGDLWAMRRLAARYRNGNGVEKDPTKAEEYYKKAEATEDALIRKANEDQRVREQAERQQKIASYEAQANNGSLPAMIALGKCYRDGDGVEKDSKKAKELFLKAANTYMVGFEKAREDAAKLALTCE